MLYNASGPHLFYYVATPFTILPRLSFLKETIRNRTNPERLAHFSPDNEEITKVSQRYACQGRCSNCARNKLYLPDWGLSTLMSS